jgi:hypothetical protein
MKESQPDFGKALELLSRLSPEQLVLLALFAGTWLIGGNVLLVVHYRRLGRPWWSGFRPFAFPFKDFNGKEWLILVALAVLSLTFAGLALSFNAPR